MTAEQLWWSRLVNSVRFLDDIQDTLGKEQSVLLLFDGAIPWEENMIETIEQRLAERNGNRNFSVWDVASVTSPGNFLLEKNCSSEERKKYWPTKQ